MDAEYIDISSIWIIDNELNKYAMLFQDDDSELGQKIYLKIVEYRKALSKISKEASLKRQNRNKMISYITSKARGSTIDEDLNKALKKFSKDEYDMPTWIIKEYYIMLCKRNNLSNKSNYMESDRYSRLLNSILIKLKNKMDTHTIDRDGYIKNTLEKSQKLVDELKEYNDELRKYVNSNGIAVDTYTVLKLLCNKLSSNSLEVKKMISKLYKNGESIPFSEYNSILMEIKKDIYKIYPELIKVSTDLNKINDNTKLEKVMDLLISEIGPYLYLPYYENVLDSKFEKDYKHHLKCL